VTLFKSIGISDTALYTGIYGLVKAIGSIIFYIWFIDRMCHTPLVTPTDRHSLGSQTALDGFVNTLRRLSHRCRRIRQGWPPGGPSCRYIVGFNDCRGQGCDGSYHDLLRLLVIWCQVSRVTSKVIADR
jgi:hypothetical protein